MLKNLVIATVLVSAVASVSSADAFVTEAVCTGLITSQEGHVKKLIVQAGRDLTTDSRVLKLVSGLDTIPSGSSKIVTRSVEINSWGGVTLTYTEPVNGMLLQIDKEKNAQLVPNSTSKVVKFDSFTCEIFVNLDSVK